MKSSIFRLLAAAALSLVSVAAPAQDAPGKPIRIVVPFPPGGIADGLARGLAERLSKNMRQTVVVDNRPGGNTIIAAEAVSAAAPDGHTFMMATDATLSVLPLLYSKLPFDPAALVPVSVVAHTMEFLVVTASVPANDVAGLVRLARERPGTLTYGSQGLGSNGHLAGATFARMAGVELTHVPYKGLIDVVNAMLGDHTQLVFAGVLLMLLLCPGRQAQAAGGAGHEALAAVSTSRRSRKPGSRSSNRWPVRARRAGCTRRRPSSTSWPPKYAASSTMPSSGRSTSPMSGWCRSAAVRRNSDRSSPGIARSTSCKGLQRRRQARLICGPACQHVRACWRGEPRAVGRSLWKGTAPDRRNRARRDLERDTWKLIRADAERRRGDVFPGG
ncbi:MAG: tripartite tricarboxylate transporter substrate-binding protein [Burkholderiaceae bacterium]